MMNTLGLLAIKAMNLIGALRIIKGTKGADEITVLSTGGAKPQYYAMNGQIGELMGQILPLVDTVTLVMIIALSAGGILYGAILGVNLARAEDAEKREAAKKRLIWAVVGLGSIVAIALILKLLLPYFPGWFEMETVTGFTPNA